MLYNPNVLHCSLYLLWHGAHIYSSCTDRDCVCVTASGAVCRRGHPPVLLLDDARRAADGSSWGQANPQVVQHWWLEMMTAPHLGPPATQETWSCKPASLCGDSDAWWRGMWPAWPDSWRRHTCTRRPFTVHAQLASYLLNFVINWLTDWLIVFIDWLNDVLLIHDLLDYLWTAVHYITLYLWIFNLIDYCNKCSFYKLWDFELYFIVLLMTCFYF